MVFQSLSLFPHMSIGENIEYPLKIKGVAEQRRKKRVIELLELLRLSSEFYQKKITECSGGERQRVAIARAIAKRPDILLCDEPTGALDSKTGIQVLEAIEHTNQTLGTTTALITHNAIIADMADRVMTFSDGRIVDVQSNASRRPVKDLSW